MTRLPVRLLLLLPAAACLVSPVPASGSENPCFCNGLAIYAHHPVQPFVVDPLGRRLGWDPEDGVFRNEMSAFYNLGEPSRTVLPTLRRKREPHPVHYIHLRPMLGKYRILAVGVDTGAYSMEITSIRGDCTRDTTLRKGRTRKGKVDVHDVEYRDGSGDSVPPATRIEFREGPWLNRSGATIRLWAEDTCSGIAKTWVKAEGAEEIEPGRFEMRREGVGLFEYWSMDNAGNLEAPRKVTVRCDFTSPSVVHDYAGGKSAVAPVDIRFRALDALSGPAVLHVGVVHVRVVTPLDMRRREFQLSGDRLHLREPGTYHLRYHAVDSAGNHSAGQLLVLEVRKEPWLQQWLPGRWRLPAGP